MHETENKLGVVVIVFYSVKQYRWHGNFLDFRKLGFHTREISHTCLLVKVTTRNCAQLFLSLSLRVLSAAPCVSLPFCALTDGCVSSEWSSSSFTWRLVLILIKVMTFKYNICYWCCVPKRYIFRSDYLIYPLPSETDAFYRWENWDLQG